jgi:UDPglucose--hexose-1-phosphate uridylyltransferase
MSEFRKDPVSGRWVIIAAERSQRPRALGVGPASSESEPCPFCAGNEAMTPPEAFADRANPDQPNSPGWRVRVVPNKYPALESKAFRHSRDDGLYESMNGVGVHEVIIESPDHVTELSQLSDEQIGVLLRVYGHRLRHWRADPRWRYLLVYKNQGERAGATLEHVHSQFLALPAVPKEVGAQIAGMKRHYETAGRCIYCDMIEKEIAQGERLVSIDERFVVLCPFAARFAYEISILPKEHVPLFEESTESDTSDLARVLRQTLTRLNRTLGKPQLNYVIHTAPVDEASSGFYHWRLDILPQLTRAAGFEWGTGMHINPVAPEAAARLLRAAAI